MLTPNEVSLYIKATLKEWGCSDIKVYWNPSYGRSGPDKRTLGQFFWWEKKIELSYGLLGSLHLLDTILKHEIAHAIDYKENGNTYTKDGRFWPHNKNFKAICKRMNALPNAEMPLKIMHFFMLTDEHKEYKVAT